MSQNEKKGTRREAYLAQKVVRRSPPCRTGDDGPVILYQKDLYIFVKVSQVTIFYSSLYTFINTNTTPKGGAPAQAEYTSKKERKKVVEKRVPVI